jgi:D-sedoheptulose 7-phosphate isomerase
MQISSCYDALRQLTQGIAITDKSGKNIELQSGFEKFVRFVTACGKYGGKLMFIGNGASASISSHMAVDFLKHAGVKAMAFNDPSLLTCMSNDYGYENVFLRPIELFADKRDILIAISSSGRSMNILSAAKAARSKRAKVITLTGFSKTNPLRKYGDLNFYVPVSKYSHVEIMHHSICHYLLDIITEEKSGRS